MTGWLSKQARVIAALEKAGIERGKPAPQGSERQSKLEALWRKLDTIEQPIAWGTVCQVARTTPECSDNALLNAMEKECWTVRCIELFNGEAGDADVAWEVISYHMEPPRERCIGEGSSLRDALRAAVAATTKRRPPSETDQ